jgi:hypothetical protein
MTILDEGQLSGLLADAAAPLDPPPDGRERILAAAASKRADVGDALDDDDDDDGTFHRLPRGRGSITLVAAAVVAIVVAIVLTSLAASGTFGPRNQSVASPPLTSPSTTFPAQNGVVGAPSLSAASISHGTHASYTYNEGNNAGIQSNSGQTPQSSSTVTGPPSLGAVQTKVVAVGTVSLSVAASRVQPVVSSLTLLAVRSGGYVASSNATARSQGSSARATVVLRVPERHFAAVVTAVQREGHVISMVTNSTDVTGEFVNYQDRIAAAQASRRQYLAIMARASTIAQILSIQSQVNQIQSEIDQLEGARNLLANQAAYGTLTVQMNANAAPPGKESGIHHAVHESVAGFVAAIEGLITGIGPALFALLAIAALLLIGRLVWRMTRRRML